MKAGRLIGSLLVLAALLAWYWLEFERAPLDTAPAQRSGPTSAPAGVPLRVPDFLPPEAHDTLALIARGGPYPHRQDGGVFQNRERRLPQRARGWYREFTVRTPGERTRGARRIVTGGDPPVEYWYSADHYGSFRRFEVAR